MTAPAHETLWRKVLNDPAATNEQRLEAAKRLEKSVLARKKIVKKAKTEVAQEQATAEAAEAQNDPCAGGDWSFLDPDDPKHDPKAELWAPCVYPGCPNDLTWKGKPYCAGLVDGKAYCYRHLDTAQQEYRKRTGRRLDSLDDFAVTPRSQYDRLPTPPLPTV